MSARQEHEAVRALAERIGELLHRFNNSLTTVVCLADWHLIAQPHEGPLREDLLKIRRAAEDAEQTAREIQRLAREAATAPTARRQPATQTRHDAVLAGQPSADATTSRVRRVLLVDDQAEVRSGLAVLVRTLGYDVDQADGAGVALTMLARRPADVVLTDLGMPDMDGRQLADAVQRRYPDIPVILLTGWADTPDDLPAAVKRVLSKPIRISQLREGLAAVLGPAA